MAGRPRRDAPPRTDPVTGQVLPAGVRWRDDRKRYQVRFRGRDLNGGRVERSELTESLGEAIAILERNKLRNGAPDGSYRVRQFYEWYVETMNSGLQVRTVQAYERSWRLRVEPFLGDLRLDALTGADVRRAAASWDVKPSTRADGLAMLSNLLNGAVEKGLIERNVTHGLRLKGRIGRESLRSRALTVDQLKQLMAFVPEGPYRRFIAAHVYTGMRTGEVSALEVSDIDRREGVIRVKRTTKPGLGNQTGPTKSGKSRTVPILPELLDQLESAFWSRSPGARAFVGPHGGVLTAKNFLRAIGGVASVREALGRPDFTMHSTRHTFATMLLDAGAPIHDVKDVMGHSSLQVTDLYTRSREDAATNAGRALHMHINGPAMAHAVVDWLNEKGGADE